MLEQRKRTIKLAAAHAHENAQSFLDEVQCVLFLLTSVTAALHLRLGRRLPLGTDWEPFIYVAFCGTGAGTSGKSWRGARKAQGPTSPNN